MNLNCEVGIMGKSGGREMEVIGEGYLGTGVMGRCEEERERVEIGGDPVGSTDLEVSKISHSCTILACKLPFECQSWR